MPNPFAGPDGSTHGRPLKGINDDPMYETVEQEDDDEGRAFLAREAEKDARLRLAISRQSLARYCPPALALALALALASILTATLTATGTGF